jgi:hypothetical protein
LDSLNHQEVIPYERVVLLPHLHRYISISS